MGRKRVLGKLTDFLTGAEISDTEDERLLQKFARFLVEEKGYARSEIGPRKKFPLEIDDETVYSRIDFIVSLDGKTLMVIKYGPGSLVTRERPAIAAARVLESYLIPCSVVTNGIDAEVLDSETGEVTGTGLESIPDRTRLSGLARHEFKVLSPKQVNAEKRIIAAYDQLEHSSECEADWCDN